MMGSKRLQPRSSVPGLGWPVVVSPKAAQHYAIWRQLHDSQWFKPAEIEALQKAQLFRRLRHAALGRPDLQAVVAQWPLKDRDAPLSEWMQALPILSRRELQTLPERVFQAAPAAHGKVIDLKTSGSSGEPVTVKIPSQNFVLRACLTLRGHEWHGVNFTAPFAAIRGGIKGKSGQASLDARQWGGVVGTLVPTGTTHALDITTPVENQLDWLLARRPTTLLSLPSNLEVLLNLISEPWPELSKVLTISETLTPHLRDRLISQWRCQVHDKYSSEELGSIGMECEHGNYHCSEHLIVEVLREDGTTCAPGEVGRVVITDTWNFATRMIRYDICDYAVQGNACACGRGLPVVSRIMGRVRNLMTLPDGRRFWPLFGMRLFGEIAPIHQLQFIQTDLTNLTIRYVANTSLNATQMQAISVRVTESVGFPFKLTFERSETPLNAGAGFKFEEFKSLVNPTSNTSVFSS